MLVDVRLLGEAHHPTAPTANTVPRPSTSASTHHKHHCRPPSGRHLAAGELGGGEVVDSHITSSSTVDSRFHSVSLRS